MRYIEVELVDLLSLVSDAVWQKYAKHAPNCTNYFTKRGAEFEAAGYDEPTVSYVLDIGRLHIPPNQPAKHSVRSTVCAMLDLQSQYQIALLKWLHSNYTR